MPSFHTYEPWHHAKHAKPAIKFLEHVASCKYIAMCPCSADTFHLPRKLAMLSSYVLFCVSRQLRSKVDESRCSNKTTTYLRILCTENTLLFTRSLVAHSSTVKCSFLFRSSRVGKSGKRQFPNTLAHKSRNRKSRTSHAVYMKFLYVLHRIYFLISYFLVSIGFPMKF